MQFRLRFFLTFVFAAFAIATATPKADANRIAAREAAMNEITDVILESRADISSFLGQLTGLLPALLQLLNAQTLNNIKGLVDNAAALLAAPFVNQTRSTIAQASSLLGSLGPLLDTLPSLLGGLAPLLDSLPDLLESVGPLLANIGPLLASLGGLLTPELIQKVGGLLDAVFSLLTPEFIAQISGLISDVAPVIAALMRLLHFLFSFDFSAPGNQNAIPAPPYVEEDYTYKPGSGLVYTPGKGGAANDPKIGPGHGVDDGAGKITFPDSGVEIDYSTGGLEGEDTDGSAGSGSDSSGGWGAGTGEGESPSGIDWSKINLGSDSTSDSGAGGEGGCNDMDLECLNAQNGGSNGTAGNEVGGGGGGSDTTGASSDTSATTSGSSQLLEPLGHTFGSIFAIASAHFLWGVVANL